MNEKSQAAVAKLRRFHGRPCPYCAVPMEFGDPHSPRRPTKDHLLPKARGGRGLHGNVLMVCGGCNVSKGDMTLIEWHAHLERVRDPRAIFVWAVIQSRDIAGFTLYDPKDLGAHEQRHS